MAEQQMLLAGHSRARRAPKKPPPALLATRLTARAHDLQSTANQFRDISPSIATQARGLLAKAVDLDVAVNSDSEYELLPMAIAVEGDLTALQDNVTNQQPNLDERVRRDLQELSLKVINMILDLRELKKIITGDKETIPMNKKDDIPMNEKLLTLLVAALVAFLVTLTIVAISNKKGGKIAVLIVGAFFAIFEVSICAVCMYKVGKGRWKELYSANRFNTFYNALFIFVGLLVLYWVAWFHLTQEEEISTKYIPMKDGIAFPRVAILQKADWFAQANLSGTSVKPKCFLGQYDNNTLSCEEKNATTDPSTCNCTNSWSDTTEKFKWHGSSYNMWNFRSDHPKLVTKSPTFMMLVQVFFTYDPSESETIEGTAANPGLFLSVYDPDKSLQDSLDKGVASLVDINALGASSGQFDNSERHFFDGEIFQAYDLRITSIPSFELVCNTSHNAKPKYACTTSVYIRAQSLIKTIMTDQHEMEWLDVMIAAGAFISFFQLMSWIVSGLFMSEEMKEPYESNERGPGRPRKAQAGKVPDIPDSMMSILELLSARRTR